VSHATICRWAREGGWQRPPFAPRATDLMPTPRASAKLRRRTLAARLDALAQRHVRELEASACVDPVKLGEALELLRMARLAARRHPRRRPGEIAPEEASSPIGQLCVGDVDLNRAPRAAVQDFLANRNGHPSQSARAAAAQGASASMRGCWRGSGSDAVETGLTVLTVSFVDSDPKQSWPGVIYAGPIVSAHHAP
jgi:hypothetical protein